MSSKNLPKISWLGHQNVVDPRRVNSSVGLTLSNEIMQFRGMSEFVDRRLPPELRALCTKLKRKIPKSKLKTHEKTKKYPDESFDPLIDLNPF